MKKLPLGIQTFSEIIEENYLYIDKTKDIYNLISSGKYYFLSRPRRFGKSLLLSTLKEVFSGSRDLFEGLYIHDKIEWKQHPVIHIDFSALSYDTPENLQKSLLSKLIDINEDYNLGIKENNYKIFFAKVIRIFYKKFGLKVVVLIDEYDKPIIDFITEPDKAKANRKVLRNFYSILKSSDQYIRFVFLTGVTKFSKMSVFSGLNNIKDITMAEEFSTILGITEQQLRDNFKKRITQLSNKLKSSEPELLGRIKHWYNGYSWDGVNRVYNPASILNLFFDNRFTNYWFSTGTPTFLIEMIRKYQYAITEIEQTQVSEFVLDSYDIDTIDINALLLQAGYLTIKKVSLKRDTYTYTLSCPNHEVKNSLINYIIADFIAESASKIAPLYIRLVDALEDKNPDTFITIIKSMFAKIPYNLHLKDEAYYHSLFYLILALMGVKINLEVLTDKGRMDGVLELDDVVYVIELKRGTAQEAIDQIDDRRYYEPYLDSGKEIFLLGVGGFDDKNIEYICKQITG